MRLFVKDQGLLSDGCKLPRDVRQYRRALLSMIDGLVRRCLDLIEGSKIGVDDEQA